ncbi:hypothetical protein GCM10009801_73040 [Streptomyces albiaxialis]|uniref:Uncharacterized protein n=1 Tax=Streptomyces albiaxialis TaxID=329523 RepID=A0ABN2WZQ8_9ACTN
MSTPHLATLTPLPGGADHLDGDQVNDAACTLVELSTVPDDPGLRERAVQQLVPLIATLRRITGTADTVDDRDWLDVWRAYGIVTERTP